MAVVVVVLDTILEAIRIRLLFLNLFCVLRPLFLLPFRQFECEMRGDE